MTNNESVNLFQELLTEPGVSASYLSNNSEILELSLSELADVNQICERIKGLGFDGEVIGKDTIRVSNKNKSLSIFWGIEIFLSEFKEVEFRDLAIFDIESQKAYYFDTGYKKLLINSEVSSDLLVSNCVFYNQILQLLKKVSKENDGFHFIDIAKSDLKQFILISEKDGKRAVIRYSRTIPKFDTDIESTYLSLKESLLDNMTREFPRFLKAAIIDYIISSYRPIILAELISEFSTIRKVALLNFNIYLNNISVDQLKSDYREYKERYLSKFTDLINKLSTQILALPISSAALIFLIYRMEKDTFALSIILFSLLTLLIYTDRVLSFYKSEIEGLNVVIDEDFDLVLKKDLFIESLSEKEYFLSIKKRLVKKTSNLKGLLYFYWPTTYLFSLIIALYALSRMYDDNSFVALVGILIFAAFLFRFSLFLWKSE